MEVRITARHGEYSSEVKDYVSDKLEPLARFNRQARSVEVILDESGVARLVEVIAHMGRGAPLVVTAEHEDVMAAVDIAHDKLERMLRRLKERESDRRRGRTHAANVPAPTPLDGPDSEEIDLDVLEA